MPFPHCRHNFVIYAVSKQHKHHSTYPAMCHRYEPGHFATFPPCSTSTALSHTRQQLKNGLVWRKGRSCSVKLIHLYICLCVCHQFAFQCLMVWERFTFTFKYILSRKDQLYVYWRAARDGAFGWGTALQTGNKRGHLTVMIFEIFFDLIFQQQCCPSIDPATNRNKSQVFLLRIKQKFV